MWWFQKMSFNFHSLETCDELNQILFYLYILMLLKGLCFWHLFISTPLCFLCLCHRNCVCLTVLHPSAEAPVHLSDNQPSSLFRGLFPIKTVFRSVVPIRRLLCGICQLCFVRGVWWNCHCFSQLPVNDQLSSRKHSRMWVLHWTTTSFKITEEQILVFA